VFVIIKTDETRVSYQRYLNPTISPFLMMANEEPDIWKQDRKTE